MCRKDYFNSKMNIWELEISPLKINIKYITGIKTLAHTMSRLITVDPDIQLDPEPEGQGYYEFDSLPDINKVPKWATVATMIDSVILMPDISLDIGISNTKMQEIQIKDDFCKHILSI